MIRENNQVISAIEEKPEVKHEIVAGVYVLNPEVLQFINDNEFLNMPDLIRLLIKENKRVVKFSLSGYWLDMGVMDNYEQAVQDHSNGLI